MLGRKTTYEILTLRDGRWTIEATATSEDTAREEAAKLLSRPHIGGVRVIKESSKSIADLTDADILFEKLRPKSDDKVFVQDIDDAPLCDNAEDLLVGPGRLTINRLFRTYLDKNNITASEVMHSAREMKRLMDEGTLIFSAVGKVSTFQTRKVEGSSTNERRDALFEFINTLNQRAVQTLDLKMPRIREVGFDEAFNHIRDMAASGKGDEDYLARFAIASELIDNRSYLGKLGQTMEWAASSQEEGALAPLDVFVSDVLNNAEVLRDLIGTPRDLGTALVTMICLAEGEPSGVLDEEEEEITPDHRDFAGHQLNTLIAAGKLPESQAVLVDRVRRQLEGLSPLSRGDREEEREVFTGLLEKLIPGLDIVGGPEMAQAVTARQSTIINKGGQKGMKEAAESMLPSLGDPARKTGYLLSLLESEIGKNALRADIDSLLDSLLLESPTVNHIVREKLPPNKKMEKITAIFHHINESSLPADRKERLTARLDELLASYIVDGKILEKLDNADRPLHVRAFMLVSMVQPEMLPQGKASELARGIIVRHLKRPNFEEELIAQIPDPAEKARTLRRFHERLHRSGFFG